MPKTDKTPEERFLEKIEMIGDGHWAWTAALNDNGYAKFWVDKIVVLGHRWAYEHWVGEIPPGYVLDHICKLRKCVNPEHLQAVPQDVNTERGDSVTAENKRKDTCKWGHPFTPENTYNPPGGKARLCKACLRRNNRSHYRRHLDRFKTKNTGYRSRNPEYDKRRYRSKKGGGL